MNRAERRREERASRGSPAAPRDRPRHWLPPVLIVAAGVLAFASGMDGAFVFDDVGNIVDTTRIRDLWTSFSGPRPFVGFSLGLNHALGGLETRGYHVFNIAVHLLAALALFGVVRRTLLGLDRPPYVAAAATSLALSAALLWVVHPLQTQSVTYVIQRSEAMMGLCYLLTLYAFIRGATTPRGWPWYVVSLATCAIGMGCKEVMVTAPFMVFLYDVIFIGGSIAGAVRRRWAFHVGLFATWGVLVLNGVLRIFSTTADTEVGFGVEELTWLDYVRTQPEVILHYIGLAFWPRHLCLDYLWPVQEQWAVFAATAGLLGVLALWTLVLLVRRRPEGYVGAWFFVILAPTSSFIPVRDLAFEHRMYLPLAAIAVAGVLAVDGLARFVARRRDIPDGKRRFGAALVLVLVIGALAVRTTVRNRDYASPLRTWQAVVNLRPENDRAQQNLGSSLLAARRVDEAEPHFRRAIELNPDNANAHVNLGTISVQRGAFDEAVFHYEAAIRIAPRNAAAHNNLGSLYARRGDMNRAYERYAEAVRLEPDYVQARFSLGRIRERRGDRQGALREYNAILAIDAAHAGARERVAALTGRGGR